MSTVSITDVTLVVSTMSDIIIENEVPFCELDSAAGDGDFGMSVAKGFKIVKAEFDTLATDSIGSFLKDVSMIITEHCGGASGPIWGSAFRSASKFAGSQESLDVAGVAGLFTSAVEGIQKRGGAKLGDKTLLDALIPAAESLKESAAKNLSLKEAFALAAASAVEGAEKTKTYTASKGRASYVGERSLSYPDAGAVAIGVIFSSVLERLTK